MLYYYLAESQNYEPHIVDPRQTERPKWAPRERFFGAGEKLQSILRRASCFIVAVGGEHGQPRSHISDALKGFGLEPVSLIDPSADLKPTSRIGLGSYVAQRVIVNHACTIGKEAILNTGASIDHECVIGDGVHIMGAAALAGRVKVGDFAVVGTNATVLPDLTIGAGCYIGAGAVVTRDVPDLSVAVGIPARVIRARAIRGDDYSVALINNAREARL